MTYEKLAYQKLRDAAKAFLEKKIGLNAYSRKIKAQN